MKIAEFNELPLMSEVKYRGKQYFLRDKRKQDHVAILSLNLQCCGMRSVRCSEISLIKKR